jgi:phosphoenolpyruvate phosphomutase / 2-hydroxyethylphosphonate cytidylyltransferase
MKILEAHSGLSALLVEKSGYDGLWVSSLTSAATEGLPDNELMTLHQRVEFVWHMKNLGIKKPIIVDVDTMGDIRHVPFFTGRFSRGGAYAIVIEDKKGEKQNSLLDNAKQDLEDVDVFCQKIRVAKANAGEMKIVARLESLIAKHSMAEALIRAEAYVKAGADMILIHSKEKVSATEVMEFAKKFKEVQKTLSIGTNLQPCRDHNCPDFNADDEPDHSHPRIPLIAIPTTYVLPDNHPFEITIHANHMLRASMKAMEKVAKGEEVELSSVQDIFDLVGH